MLLSCALEPCEILFATLSFIFHAFPLCITNLPRKLTVFPLFSPLFFFFFTLTLFPLQQSLRILRGVKIFLYRIQLVLISPQPCSNILLHFIIYFPHLPLKILNLYWLFFFLMSLVHLHYWAVRNDCNIQTSSISSSKRSRWIGASA